MLETAEVLATTVLMYLGTRDGEFPEQAMERLERIVSRDDASLTELFPKAPLERVKQLTRSSTVARNYHRLGYELQFTAGFGFDAEAFIDSLLIDASVLIEAHIFIRDEPDGPDREIFRAGSQRIDDPENYDWELLGDYRFNKWRNACDEQSKRYFSGHRVVFTGSFRKKNPDQVAHEGKVLGAIVQNSLDEKTTLVVVGHDPDRSLVNEAIQRGIALLSERFFLHFVQLGERVGWTYNQFKPEQYPRVAKFIVRELNFTFSGDLESSGRTIAAICKDKEKTQKTTQRLKKEHREAFHDIEEMKGKRVFDVVELPDENTIFLVFDGHGDKPRQAQWFAWQGEFLVYAETEIKAHKYAIQDLQAQQENILSGTMAALSNDAEALGQLIATNKSLSYDEPSQRLEISEKTSPDTMIELNRLLKIPLYTIRKSSPIEIMQFEQELEVNTM